MNMFKKENFISNKECNSLIDFHKKNFNLNNNFSKIHYDTEVLLIYDMQNTSLFKKINNLLNNFIKSHNKKYKINYFELVKWLTGADQREHVDLDYHPYTSIIYLNNNYVGGETVITDKMIYPKKGKLIAFEGNKILHKVNTIKKGIRYTLPCWYTYESN